MRRGSSWLPRIGWTLAVLFFAVFVWGLERRSRLQVSDEQIIRMLFVPSVEQGTLVRRGDQLATYIRQDTGLTLKVEVPTSYAAVIQALGSGQADLAWMPAFAYVIANARYEAEARLQVVRTAERSGLVIVRSSDGGLESLEDLAGTGIAMPGDLAPELDEMMRRLLDERAPGWTEVAVANAKEAVRRLLDRPSEVSAAISSWVFSGPHDFVGDGRKELEYERPGTVRSTRELFRTEETVSERVAFYHGCIFTRVDSPFRRVRDFNGRRFAFSDETSTSGHIFPRMLLDREGVTLGRVFYAGGHPNVIQAVLDGKADGGAGFYSPPNDMQREQGLFVGDARFLILKRMREEERLGLLDEIRVLKLSDPIPNDVCAVRKGFPEPVWKTFEESFQRYLETDEGLEVYFDILAAIGAAPTDDSAFDGFRQALRSANISAEGLLEEAERKLEEKRRKEKQEGSGS